MMRARTTSLGPRIGLALALVLSGACGESAPPFTEPKVLGGVEIPVETLNHGQRLYMRSCASCHGVDGGGKGPAARSLNPGPRDFRTADFLYKSTPGDELPTDEDLARTIRNGRLERGMPSWRGFQETDILALVHFIKTYSPRWRTSSSTPVDAGAKDESAASENASSSAQP